MIKIIIIIEVATIKKINPSKEMLFLSLQIRFVLVLKYPIYIRIDIHINISVIIKAILILIIMVIGFAIIIVIGVMELALLPLDFIGNPSKESICFSGPVFFLVFGCLSTMECCYIGKLPSIRTYLL